MHFIELNKFKKDYKDVKTALDKWVSFLNIAYEIDKDKIPKELENDENIKKALEKLDIMYLDNEEREIYENDLKALRIHNAEIKTAEEKGIQKGIQKGEKNKASEIAKNLLDVLDNETIAVKTGLTIEEIQKLR